MMKFFFELQLVLFSFTFLLQLAKNCWCDPSGADGMAINMPEVGKVVVRTYLRNPQTC